MILRCLLEEAERGVNSPISTTEELLLVHVNEASFKEPKTLKSWKTASVLTGRKMAFL